MKNNFVVHSPLYYILGEYKRKVFEIATCFPHNGELNIVGEWKLHPDKIENECVLSVWWIVKSLIGV